MACTGEDGKQGEAGTNGINGNANVIGGEPFTTASINWGIVSGSGGTSWTANLTGATSITQSIVDKGTISVFRKYGTQWSALPDTNTNINISFSYELGKITLLAQSTNGAVISNPGAITFRYVAISPANKIANPKANWNDYNEVKTVLNLNN